MKQFLLLTCLLVSGFAVQAQTVFVNASAAGGDGTSWATAYNDLNLALLEAPAGASVWIAAGTYTTPDSASFFIDKELSVLGGFAGDETSADAADPSANVTILSGDFGADDVVGQYDSLNAATNNNRILIVTDTSESSKFIVTLDGLTFMNGKVAANFPGQTSLVPFSGAGILSFARLAGSRLSFTGNFADFGSAMSLVGNNASGSSFDGLSFSNNFSGLFSQVYMNGVNDVTFSNASFNGNDLDASSGFIGVEFCQDIAFDNCSFTGLFTGDAGAAAFINNCDDITVSNSSVENVSAGFGGGFYIAQADNLASDQDENDFLFENVTFDNISISARGGAIAHINSSIKLVNCTLNDLTSASIGGGIYGLVVTADTLDYTQTFINTTFTNLTENLAAGGGICVLARGAGAFNGIIDSCTFDNNVSPGGQGAAIYADGSNFYTVSNTTFSSNLAAVGTIIQRGFVGSTFDNVVFENNGDNTSAFQGAGIVYYFNEGSPGASFDSCRFSGNVVTNSGSFTSGGAGIYALGGDLTPVPLSITNSQFINNAATDSEVSGGALHFIGGFDVGIENTEFAGNSAGRQGGAIQLDTRIAARDTAQNGEISVFWQPLTSKISNSLFADQIAGLQGGAIAADRAATDLTNCIFINNLVNVASGGAIIYNGVFPYNTAGELQALDTLALSSIMVNNTFIDNLKGESEAAVGDHIALFQVNDSASDDLLSIEVIGANNAFFLSTGAPAIETEPGTAVTNTTVPVGEIMFQSIGGNFFNAEIDPILSDLLQVTDIINEDVNDVNSLFVDPFDDNNMGRNFAPVITDPISDNPLINNGVITDLLPDAGINGTPRGDAPDIGAVEVEQGLVNTDEPIENSGLALSFFPNPTSNVLNIRNSDATINRFTVLMSDQAGRIITAKTFSGANNTMNMTQLPAGVYNLRLVVNGAIYSKQVVKQ